MTVTFVKQRLHGGFWKPVRFFFDEQGRQHKFIVYWLGLKLSVTTGLLHVFLRRVRSSKNQRN